MTAQEVNGQMLLIRMYLSCLAELKVVLSENSERDLFFLLGIIRQMKIVSGLSEKLAKVGKNEDWEYFSYLMMSECLRMEKKFFAEASALENFPENWPSVRKNFERTLLALSFNTLDRNRLLDELAAFFNSRHAFDYPDITEDVVEIVASVWGEDVELLLFQAPISEDCSFPDADNNAPHENLPPAEDSSENDINRYLDELNRLRKK